MTEKGKLQNNLISKNISLSRTRAHTHTFAKKKRTEGYIQNCSYQLPLKIERGVGERGLLFALCDFALLDFFFPTNIYSSSYKKKLINNNWDLKA